MPSAAPDSTRASRIRSLSFHANYACGNSGQCCSAGWPIPVEPDVLPMLERAISDGQAIPINDVDAPLTYPADRPASIGAVLGRTSQDHACMFFDRVQRDGCCRVQRHAGVRAMPTSCRQFPRIARHDLRGTDVSLSHWCPTAVALLATPGPSSIVDAPPAFPMASDFEGLDARVAWPPLLRPGCLLDLDTFDVIERHAVAILTMSQVALPGRVEALERWFERLRTWDTRQGSLGEFTAETMPATVAVLEGSRATQAAQDGEAWRGEALWDAVIDAIPVAERSRVPAGLGAVAADVAEVVADPTARDVMGRYLAARLFGSWVAYQGQGLRSMAAGVHAALAVLGRTLALNPRTDVSRRVTDAIRTADLLLVHLASPEALARQFSTWERRRP